MKVLKIIGWIALIIFGGYVVVKMNMGVFLEFHRLAHEGDECSSSK